MENDDMVSMKFHKKDWEAISDALENAESGLGEAARYARNQEDLIAYRNMAEHAYNIKENIQYQLGNRSNKDNP